MKGNVNNSTPIRLARMKWGYLITHKRTYASTFPAGVYKMGNNDMGFYIAPWKPEGDEEETRPVDVLEPDRYFPMEKYDAGIASVDDDIHRFLDREAWYRSRGIAYRRNVLFYGPPGTGKTKYVEHLQGELVEKHDAVVFRIEDSHSLSSTFHAASELQVIFRDRLKVFVIEELSDFVSKGLTQMLSNLLDSCVLRDKVLFLMTTNNPETIPIKLIDRPSRIDVIKEVSPSGYSRDFVPAWYEHVMGEPLPEEDMSDPWFKRALDDNLSAAHWKEIFLFSMIHDVSLGDSYLEIVRRRRLIKSGFREERVTFNDPVPNATRSVHELSEGANDGV